MTEYRPVKPSTRVQFLLPEITQEDFPIGSSVRYTEEYLNNHYHSKPHLRETLAQRVGVIVGHSPRYPTSVKLLWDGTVTSTAMNVRFLELVK